MQVVAPVGVGVDGQTYDVNADAVAGAVAGALDAERLLMSPTCAACYGPDGTLIPEMTIAGVKKGIAGGRWISSR